MSFLSDITAFASMFGQGGMFGKSQVSNRDYQHQQNLLDSGNPREIARQTDFLAGLAPAQGAAYNTIQDATYAQDTQRQTDRIQTMGAELGMSPWEITGAPGSAPLPSPTGPAPQNNNPQYMGALTQLKTAEMANKTQLQIAAMNNQTSERNVERQTGTAERNTDVNAAVSRDNMIMQTANGRTAFSQLDVNTQNMLESQARILVSGIDAQLKTAQIPQTNAQTANIQADTDLKKTQNTNVRQQTSESITREIVMKDKNLIDALSAILPFLPKTTITTPLGGVEERTGANDFLKGFGNLQTNSGGAQTIADALYKSDARQWNDLLDAIKKIAGN